MQTKLNFKTRQLPLAFLKNNIRLNTKILNLTLNELKNFYNSKLSENPFLEEYESQETNQENEIKKNEIFKNKDKEEKYFKHLSYQISNNSFLLNNKKSPDDVFRETLKEEKSLYDFLQEQLLFNYQEDSQEYEIGIYLISFLDDVGYISLNNFSKVKKKFGNISKNVWDVIKTFNPVGIGAQNLQECLLIQLSQFKLKNKIGIKIIKEYFNLFIKKEHKLIAKQMNIKLEMVKREINKISFLEHQPKRNYTKKTSYIYPDVKVEEKNRELILIINNEEIPKIYFNSDYLFKESSLKKENMDKKFTDFYQEKKQEAKNLIYALRYRNVNLVKIMSYIIKIQRFFFFEGEKKLLTDTLTNCSNEIGINLSTLSRLVNNKFIDTKWGIFPLKYFFSANQIGKKNKGFSSSQKVKIYIKEIIAKNSLISDQKITQILNKKGIKISRRTINKYRNKMNILSSYTR